MEEDSVVAEVRMLQLTDKLRGEIAGVLRKRSVKVASAVRMGTECDTASWVTASSDRSCTTRWAVDAYIVAEVLLETLTQEQQFLETLALLLEPPPTTFSGPS